MKNVFARPAPDFRRTNGLLLRLLAGIYFLAFASLSVQIIGLCGAKGVLPASEWLAYLAGQSSPAARFWTYPTVFWFGTSDGWLLGAAAAGSVFALAAAAGFLPLFSFAACFFLYLSFYTAAGPFLHFQWDLLLLESGFLAVLAAPAGSFRNASEPPRAVVFLFRFLIFKLIFTSGLCKLASGDAAWRTLTALRFHYETQPLPPWSAWYFHHLPDAFQRFSAVVMFVIELVFPFFILLGRKGRMAAFWGIVCLQILIAASGNYGFFNWLTIALALSLLDDGLLKIFSGSKISAPAHAARRATALGACVLLVPLSLYLTAVRWVEGVPRAGFVDRWLVAPLQTWPLIGAYGLFSVMTTERREIVLEGSDDGQEWKEYEFRWKPGDPKRRPAFTGTHMPRLDWQMWFAALGTWRQNPWFMQLCRRILEGSPSVLKLMGRDPFAGHPPKYVRAVFYEYTFSDNSKRQKGIWWERRLLGQYCPALTLKDT